MKAEKDWLDRRKRPSKLFKSAGVQRKKELPAAIMPSVPGEASLPCAFDAEIAASLVLDDGDASSSADCFECDSATVIEALDLADCSGASSPGELCGSPLTPPPRNVAPVALERTPKLCRRRRYVALDGVCCGPAPAEAPEPMVQPVARRSGRLVAAPRPQRKPKLKPSGAAAPKPQLNYQKWRPGAFHNM